MMALQVALTDIIVEKFYSAGLRMNPLQPDNQIPKNQGGLALL